jgi:hypothetical protein
MLYGFYNSAWTTQQGGLTIGSSRLMMRSMNCT